MRVTLAFVVLAALATPAYSFSVTVSLDQDQTKLTEQAAQVKALEDKVRPIFQQENAMEDFGCEVQITIGPDGQPQPTVVCSGGVQF